MIVTKQLVSSAVKLKPECLVGLTLKAPICHKSKLPPQKAYRFPYETRSYGYRSFWRDPFTEKKFNDNSKIIQIEGNIEAGKEDLGRRLAEELGMYYMPHVDLEGYYINDMGFDYRALNPLLPERLRLCDWKMWHECPSRHSIVHMQHYLYKMRLTQYILALRHIFNTGQGVILNRSVFTEQVLAMAMHEMNWLPQGYLRGDGVQFYDYISRHNYIRNLSLGEVLKPHLTIYLETPVDVCMDRIRNSSDPVTANSKALVPEFLQAIEKSYEDVLDRQAYSGHVMRIDYPERANGDELQDIVDDIEKLDFTYNHRDYMFEDWQPDKLLFWHFVQRRHWTSYSTYNEYKWLDSPWFDIAGLGDSITQGDLILRDVLYDMNVGQCGLYAREEMPGITIWSRFKDPNNFGKSFNRLVRNDFV